jgi:hypothetical protein
MAISAKPNVDATAAKELDVENCEFSMNTPYDIESAGAPWYPARGK